MTDKKILGNEKIEIPSNGVWANSSEQSVCAPEFPDGCMDVEVEEK